MSPGLHVRGPRRGLGSSKGLGPVDSGVSTASFETAREDVLSRMGSATTSGQQEAAGLSTASGQPVNPEGTQTEKQRLGDSVQQWQPRRHTVCR